MIHIIYGLAKFYLKKKCKWVSRPHYSEKLSSEILKGTLTYFKHLRVFGSIYWAHVPNEKRSNLESKSEIGLVLDLVENITLKIWFPDR